MPSLRKSVAVPGSYLTPDGPADAPASRLRHWTDSINAMVATGIKPPVSWGHTSGALPATEDDATYWASKSVAGKLTGAEIDALTGEMFVLMDVPGVEIDSAGRMIAKAELADGRLVPSAIEEVSLGVRDWTDGSGRLWPDAPIHLALTPLPVMVPPGGQTPFAIDAGSQHFGLAGLLVRFGEGAPPNTEEPPEKGEGETKVAGEGEVMNLKKVVEMLGRCGVQLPPDTTPENLIERLYVACTAKEGEMQSADGTTGLNQTVEQTPGTYLSTLRADPLGKLIVQRIENTERAERLDRIAKLQAKGLPVHRAKRYRQEATVLRFSLAADGSTMKTALDEKLDVIEEVLDGVRHGSALFSSQIVEATTPEDEDTTAGPTKAAKLAEEMAKNSRLPARAKR